MKEPITSPQAPAAIGPYSAAITTGSLIFVSGQLPINPATGEMPPKSNKKGDKLSRQYQ